MKQTIGKWLQAIGLWLQEVQEPFDIDYPDSLPPIDADFECPTTQPTSPGALDSDLGDLR